MIDWRSTAAIILAAFDSVAVVEMVGNISSNPKGSSVRLRCKSSMCSIARSRSLFGGTDTDKNNIEKSVVRIVLYGMNAFAAECRHLKRIGAHERARESKRERVCESARARADESVQEQESERVSEKQSEIANDNPTRRTLRVRLSWSL